jgi:alcohol dehydrogenase
MKAWMLDEPGTPLALRDVEGKLPYAYPPGPFSPGTNGVGSVEAVGEGVMSFHVGQRVAVNPYWIANETVPEPAQVLIALTGLGADSAPMLAEFPHGTLREVAEFPASTLIPLDGLDDLPAERLAILGKFAVPFGGLRRGRLAAGETVIVNGATGYFGSAAVLVALAMGASRVVALGRRAQPLQTLVELGRGRVVPVVLSGDAALDVTAIRTAAGGGADLAFDMLGNATDANATLATLRSLRRGGRLVLMGSMLVDLPLPYREMLQNNWELIGHFMYTPADYLALVALAASRQLPLASVELKTFSFAALEAAIDEASRMSGLQCTVVCGNSPQAWA